MEAGRSGSGRSARFWPAILLGLLAHGCGGATAPCPTPTTQLDQLRAESKRLERDLDRASGEEARLRARQAEAAGRIEAAYAALDSLGVTASP